MARNPALSVLGLLTLVVGVVAAIVAIVLLTLHAGAALGEHFRPFLAQPLPPITVGQALATVIVLAILLSFRR